MTAAKKDDLPPDPELAVDKTLEVLTCEIGTQYCVMLTSLDLGFRAFHDAVKRVHKVRDHMANPELVAMAIKLYCLAFIGEVDHAKAVARKLKADNPDKDYWAEAEKIIRKEQGVS